MNLPLGFAAGPHDRDTGLIHFGYREYDPATGRFTCPDPLGYAGCNSHENQETKAGPDNQLPEPAITACFLVSIAAHICDIAMPSPKVRIQQTVVSFTPQFASLYLPFISSSFGHGLDIDRLRGECESGSGLDFHDFL
ncbi:hypothetical protein N7E73_15815 [Maridesulfovibrio sp. FT414]